MENKCFRDRVLKVEEGKFDSFSISFPKKKIIMKKNFFRDRVPKEEEGKLDLFRLVFHRKNIYQGKQMKNGSSSKNRGEKILSRFQLVFQTKILEKVT